MLPFALNHMTAPNLVRRVRFDHCTVLGVLIMGVIISGFTSLKLDADYQDMTMGAIIVGAVVLDRWRQLRWTRV